MSLADLDKLFDDARRGLVARLAPMRPQPREPRNDKERAAEIKKADGLLEQGSLGESRRWRLRRRIRRLRNALEAKS